MFIVVIIRVCTPFFYRNITDCQDCTPGWYCGGSGLHVPTAECAPGYYCTGRAENDHQHECPRGYKCPLGSANPEPCEAGYYQNETGQSTCRICPRGFYCNDTNGPVISYGQYICIEGHYCPNGTRYAEEFKCPPGTFNNRTGMDEQADCLPCTGRYVCDEWGLIRPNRLCGAGYYCREGANSTTPNLGDKANICPEGYYCPEGMTNRKKLSGDCRKTKLIGITVAISLATGSKCMLLEPSVGKRVLAKHN